MTDQQVPAGPERPARYQRSISGGIGSLILLVVAVLGFVAFRAVFRQNDSMPTESVDYLAVVQEAQQGRAQLVYPASLPSGWRATSVDFLPGDQPAFGVGMLTVGGKYVGVRQQDADLSSLLQTYVDQNPVQGKDVRVPGAIAPTWQEWSDAGGDHAYAATVAGDQVLVYGSAPIADLLTIVRSLTDAPAGG